MQQSIRNFLATAAMLIVAVAAHSEITIKDVLRSVPDSIVIPLTRSVLSDLIEYFEVSQNEKTLANELRGEAQILEMDSIHAKIKTGNARTLTFNILTTKSDTVFAVIETLETPINDSQLTIYDNRWEPQTKLWKEPKSKDWLNDYGKKNRADFEHEVPYILAEYTIDPITSILTLTNRSKENKFMLSELRYKWTKKGFKIIKND